MVNIGDIVLISIRAFEPSLALFENNVRYLQDRLQAAGFRVLSVDDSGLGWTGSWGQLLVSVQPLTSAYAQPEDIGSIVRGAAETAGYGAPTLESARIVERATSAGATPGSTGAGSTGALPGYTANLQTAPLETNSRGLLDDLSATMGISTGVLTLGALALGAVLVISLVRK